MKLDLTRRWLPRAVVITVGTFTLVASAQIFARLKLPSSFASDAGGKLYQVSGTSMMPFLQPGEQVWISFAPLSEAQLKRGDVLLVQPPAAPRPLIKSLIATPGDQFEVHSLVDSFGSRVVIFVNGEKLVNRANQEYALREERKIRQFKRLEVMYQRQVPAASFLVLGENPNGSFDSTEFGFIGIEHVIGKADAN